MNEKKINILLVEDDVGFSRLFNLKMEKDSVTRRFNIETVESLKDCFTTIESGNTDIVLLDLGLLETSGLETIEKFHNTCPDMPVIVLTAHSEESIGIESIKKGASAFLEKQNLDNKNIARTILHSLERHEIQQQLKIEKQNVNDYLDLAAVIIVTIDTNQKITMVNKTGCQLLGYSDDDLLGKNWFDIFTPSEKKMRLKKQFDTIITEQKETPINFETVIAAANGKHRIISWNRKFIRDKNDNITGILGSGTDVTSLKISKRKLKKINIQIREHDIQKSEFIINISHELRTPLTIFKNIISNALAGTSGKIDPKLEKELRIGNKAIDRLAGIITDFLDISNIEAGKMKLNLDSIQMRQLVTDAIDMHKTLIDSNYMDVNVIMPQESITLTADYRKMVQILGKLIENAAKFVPDCGGKMSIRVTDLKNKIGIDVEDNGPGIQGDNINRVFNRFIQVQRHVGEGDHGTGLGLAITKELVEMHCGRIWVENKKEGGTIFKMIIPKKPPISPREESHIISEIEKTIASLADQADQIAEICDQCSNMEKENEPQENTASPIDWNLALKYCGDETVIKRIADSIMKDSPDQLQALIKAVESKVAKDIVYTAHKLKGSILTIGATDLPHQGEIIEIAAGQNDLETVNATMPELQKEYDRFMKFLSKKDWTTLAKNTINC